MKWSFDPTVTLIKLWNQGVTGDRIALELQRYGSCNRGEVYREAKRIGLDRRPRGPTGWRRGATVPHVSAQRRIPPTKGGAGLVLARDHQAVRSARTIFTKSVRNADDVLRILKSGHNQRKVGKRVAKGPWRGFEIYCLTLEERRTCPRTCEHWRSCYGNNMHLAERIRHGPAFERRLWAELEMLQAKHPAGFVVRLHILGDFYSRSYVGLWAMALKAFPALHVFGYTARQKNTPIGRALLALSVEQWERFAMRFSGYRGERGATTFKRGGEPTGIHCPAQSGKTDCCATCGLCWSTLKEISFEHHGDRKGMPRSPGTTVVHHLAHRLPKSADHRVLNDRERVGVV